MNELHRNQGRDSLADLNATRAVFRLKPLASMPRITEDPAFFTDAHRVYPLHPETTPRCSLKLAECSTPEACDAVPPSDDSGPKTVAIAMFLAIVFVAVLGAAVLTF